MMKSFAAKFLKERFPEKEIEFIESHVKEMA